MNFFGKGMAERMKGGIKWAKIWSKCNLKKPPHCLSQRLQWNWTILLYSVLFSQNSLSMRYFSQNSLSMRYFSFFWPFYVYGMNQTSSVSGKPKMPKMQISLINYMSSWDRDVDRTQTFPLIMPFGSFRICVYVFSNLFGAWDERKEEEAVSLPLYKNILVWSKKKSHIFNIEMYTESITLYVFRPQFFYTFVVRFYYKKIWFFLDQT